MKKLTIITAISTVFLVTTLTILFIPLLITKPFVVIERSQKTNPKTEYVITKFDLFKPKVTTLLPLDDGTIYASVSDFERYNLIFFKDTGYNDGIKKPIDEGAVDARISNKSIEDVLKITRENDLSKVNPDVKNIDGVGVPQFSGDEKEYRQKLEEASKPENRYYDRLKLEVQKEPNRFPFYNENRDVRMFQDLKMGDLFLDFQNKISGGETINVDGKATGLDEAIFVFNNSKINFIAVGFDDLGILGKDDKYKTAKLQKIVIVKQDRTFVEVPTKPDGSFDFEVVKNQWE